MSYRFTIVIAVYNTGPYLNETVESLIHQTIGFQDHVQLRLEKDAIVMDLTGIKDEPKIKKVVIGWNNVKQVEFPAYAYKIEMDISAEKDKSWTGIYFEGRTLEGKHYYKLFNQNAFKDKRTIKVPKEEQLRFENTHEPIIDQKTWDIVPMYRSSLTLSGNMYV